MVGSEPLADQRGPLVCRLRFVPATQFRENLAHIVVDPGQLRTVVRNCREFLYQLLLGNDSLAVSLRGFRSAA